MYRETMDRNRDLTNREFNVAQDRVQILEKRKQYYKDGKVALETQLKIAEEKVKTLIDEIISHRQLKDERDNLQVQIKNAEEKIERLHSEAICNRYNFDKLQKQNVCLNEEVDNLKNQVAEEKRQVEAIRQSQFVARPNIAAIQPSLSLGDDLPPFDGSYIPRSPTPPPPNGEMFNGTPRLSFGTFGGASGFSSTDEPAQKRRRYSNISVDDMEDGCIIISDKN